MPRLEAYLVTPERELWSGEARMVIARGTEGEVGVLAGHAPMLIRLAIGVARIQHDGEEERAAVDGGFLHVSTTEDVTRVDILADGGELANEIDVAEAQRLRDDARRRADAGDEEAQRDLARAEARLSLREG